MLVPPVAAVVADHFAGDEVWRYVIIALFATGAIIFYPLAVSRQERAWQRRELEILDAVTGREG